MCKGEPRKNRSSHLLRMNPLHHHYQPAAPDFGPENFRDFCWFFYNYCMLMLFSISQSQYFCPRKLDWNRDGFKKGWKERRCEKIQTNKISFMEIGEKAKAKKRLTR